MPLRYLKIPPMPTPMQPHTFVNELQVRSLKAAWINNILLAYIAVFFTVKLLGAGL